MSRWCFSWIQSRPRSSSHTTAGRADAGRGVEATWEHNIARVVGLQPSRSRAQRQARNRSRGVVGLEPLERVGLRVGRDARSPGLNYARSDRTRMALRC